MWLLLPRGSFLLNNSSAISTSGLHHGLFWAHSRMSHAAPPNCNRAGKCADPDAQGSRNTDMGKHWKSPPPLGLFYFNPEILNISTVIFIFSMYHNVMLLKLIQKRFKISQLVVEQKCFIFELEVKQRKLNIIWSTCRLNFFSLHRFHILACFNGVNES